MRKLLISVLILLLLPGLALAGSTKILLVATQNGEAVWLIHASLDPDDQALTLTPIDAAASIGDQSAAACYAASGGAGLVSALSSRLPADYYLVLKDTPRCVDLFGGVPLKLNRQELHDLGLGGDAGTRTVSGDVLMQFIPMAFSGTSEQRDRLQAAAGAFFKKLTQEPADQLLTKIPKLITHVSTNMPLSEMGLFAKELTALNGSALALRSFP